MAYWLAGLVIVYMIGILTVLLEVHDQVLLALEPVGQFLSLHVTQGALLGIGDFVAFHIFLR